eukprot:gene11117-9699_t
MRSWSAIHQSAKQLNAELKMAIECLAHPAFESMATAGETLKIV